jgi:hypothetical protein
MMEERAEIVEIASGCGDRKAKSVTHFGLRNPHSPRGFLGTIRHYGVHLFLACVG